MNNNGYRNAKQEFINEVGDKKVLCAKLYTEETRYKEGDGKTWILKVGYSQEDYAAFLDQLDFEYYASYGGQELFGNIWYKNGTWSERHEYDGAEWWQYQEVPLIPDEVR